MPLVSSFVESTETTDVASIANKGVVLSVVPCGDDISSGDTIVLFDVELSLVANVTSWWLEVSKLPSDAVVMVSFVDEPFSGVVDVVWGTLELFENVIPGIVGLSIFKNAPSKIHWYIFPSA